MPKVFRPKIVHQPAKTVSKEPALCSKTGDTRPRSPSPTAVSVLTKAIPTKLDTYQTPSKDVSDIPSDSTPSKTPIIDIDQPGTAIPLTPIRDIQVDLFSTKKVKRIHHKPTSDPVPDLDKPLDRSNVSLRSLLNWNPINKPPPTYRQNRSSASAASSVHSEEVIRKSDASPVKPIPVISTLPSDTALQPDLLAPQLRLDADGNIVLDETSLLVSLPETTANTSGVRFVDEESGLLSVTYNSFRPPPEKRGGRWDARETVRFYRALSTIGPDFYLMLKLFPNRNRGELKRKFKRESRTHPYLVNQALRNRRAYDITALVTLSDDDETEGNDVKTDMNEKIESKPIVKAKRRLNQSLTRKAQKTGKTHCNYDPNKVLDTIDSVLAQETSYDNLPGPRTSSHQTNSVLDRMIAAKQREVEAETADATRSDRSDVCLEPVGSVRVRGTEAESELYPTDVHQSHPVIRAHSPRIPSKQREV